MAEFTPRGTGWMREHGDVRDYWFEVEVPRTSGKSKAKKTGSLALQHLDSPSRTGSAQDVTKSLAGLTFAYPPPTKHLSNLMWCPPIEDQRTLGSCTAQAGVGLLEYYERRTHGKHIDASKLFLYKATRNLLGWTGDTGAYCRTTMAALAMFGVAIEEYWPYTDAVPDFDREPTSFVYSMAQNFQGLTYHRVDAVGASTPLETRIKIMIAIGWPLMFGFTCYQSLRDADVTASGEIPFPTPAESRIGGHAVVAVGYDNNKKIENSRSGGIETKGAFLIRNSWGTNWGFAPDDPPGMTRGYGWLPYKYLSSGLASDWWSLTKAEWINTGVFGK